MANHDGRMHLAAHNLHGQYKINFPGQSRENRQQAGSRPENGVTFPHMVKQSPALLHQAAIPYAQLELTHREMTRPGSLVRTP